MKVYSSDAGRGPQGPRGLKFVHQQDGAVRSQSRSARTARIEIAPAISTAGRYKSRSARTARIEIKTCRSEASPPTMSRSARTARIEIVMVSKLEEEDTVAVRKDRED